MHPRLPVLAMFRYGQPGACGFRARKTATRLVALTKKKRPKSRNSARELFEPMPRLATESLGLPCVGSAQRRTAVQQAGARQEAQGQAGPEVRGAWAWRGESWRTRNGHRTSGIRGRPLFRRSLKDSSRALQKRMDPRWTSDFGDGQSLFRWSPVKTHGRIRKAPEKVCVCLSVFFKTVCRWKIRKTNPKTGTPPKKTYPVAIEYPVEEDSTCFLPPRKHVPPLFAFPDLFSWGLGNEKANWRQQTAGSGSEKSGFCSLGACPNTCSKKFLQISWERWLRNWFKRVFEAEESFKIRKVTTGFISTQLLRSGTCGGPGLVYR